MDWKSTGSAIATLMFLKSIPTLIPAEVSNPIRTLLSHLSHSLNLHRFLRPLDPMVTVAIDQFDPAGFSSNIFDSVQAYLSSKSLAASRAIKMHRHHHSKTITYSLSPNESIVDTFDGVTVTWTFRSIYGPDSNSRESRSFDLRFHYKHRAKVHAEYLPFVLSQAAAIQFKNRERKPYTNRNFDGSGMLWTSIPFTHPSTFDTVAMDPGLKEEIKNDLLKFVGRKEFYARVGRAWKRGYLLYGPPGTGKTSLIAAIANFLEFDIYDLELTSVMNNSHLRKLLVATTTKSVIVVEDVDCTVNLSSRGTKRASNGTEIQQFMSLSGVLNFVDGLWSSCGGERLMIFTTNHKENLDPALLRPGRMDKHINMGYCGFAAFKMLIKNYLGVDKHMLMEEVEETLPSAQMTPADVAEALMGSDGDPDQGMSDVVEAIRKRRRIENEAAESAQKENKVSA